MKTGIIIKRTKLFDTGLVGESPVGSAFYFDILENTEFKKRYNHHPISKLNDCVDVLLEKWNSASATNWSYERVGNDNVKELEKTFLIGIDTTY